MSWTEKLIEPLATSLRNTGPWIRVEESRTGGWLCLAGNPGDPAINWHQLQEDGSLQALEPMKDKRLPAMATACSKWISEGYSLQLLAWRVGSRSIFRLSRNMQFCYAKIFRRDRLTVERWQYLAMGSPGGLWRVPEIIDWNQEDKILIIEEKSGHSLNQQWTSGIWLDQHLEALKEVLHWLATTPPSDKLPIHTIEEETNILNTRLEVFHRTLKEPHKNAEPLVQKVIKKLNCLGNQDLVLCHRDLHDKQIITAWEGGSLIDLDLLAQGSPALDSGNIIAHCHLRAAQGHPIPWQSVAKVLVNDAHERGVELEALQTWTASTLARLSLIYARRRRHDNLITQLLNSLNDLLENTGEWKEIFE